MNYRVTKVGLRLEWSCTDHAKHDHRYWLGAWICGRLQAWRARGRIG